MSRLFIELYLDEDMPVLVADLIKAIGFQAITTRDANQLQNSDRKQLDYATKHQKTLVTHNKVDFELLAREYFEQGKKHYDIIFAVRHSTQEVARRLLIILNNVTVDEIENQVRYI